jgi:hypothetical protein
MGTIIAIAYDRGHIVEGPKDVSIEMVPPRMM